jgi:hypothetical protein
VGLLGFATAATGSTYGLKGYSSSTSGTGVRGLSTATTGATVGISASVASPAGTAGVFNNVAGGKILSGQNNGMEEFSVDGSGNVNSTSGSYQIGGYTVLNVGSVADANLFLGVAAGASNVTGSGTSNVFSGDLAGYHNTTGSQNVFSGEQVGYSNTTGNLNTFSGYDAGESNTTGGTNTFSGFYAGLHNTTGSANTFYGALAGDNNVTGNNNIYVGNSGPGSESNTIRIGGDIGIGYGSQTAAYIAGLYGASTNGGSAVYVDSTGKLGTTGGTVSGLVMTSVIQNYTSSVDISCPSGYNAVLASCQVGVNVVLNDVNSPLPPGASSWADYLTPSVNNATGVHCDVGAANQSQAQLRCAQQ